MSEYLDKRKSKIEYPFSWIYVDQWTIKYEVEELYDLVHGSPSELEKFTGSEVEV